MQAPAGAQTKHPDPAVALEHALQLGKGSRDDRLVRKLLSKWALENAEAALGWASSLEDPAARHSARASVCLAVAEKDPRRALVLALTHGADQDGDGSLVESLAMQWCEMNSKAVLDWVLTQPAGEWRDRLVARVSFVLSRLDPAGAAALVSELESGPLHDEAAMAVLHQWALRDPGAASEWADSFLGNCLRERALAELSHLRDSATCRID